MFAIPDEKLFEVCSSDPSMEEKCSRLEFWQDRFHKKNLPMLEEGRDFFTWYSIYRTSKFTKYKTNIYLDLYEKLSEDLLIAKINLGKSILSQIYIPEISPVDLSSYIEEASLYRSINLNVENVEKYETKLEENKNNAALYYYVVALEDSIPKNYKTRRGFLYIVKQQGKFCYILSIEEGDKVLRRLKVETNDLPDLIYRLNYYNYALKFPKILSHFF